jgi:hypothetical protein
MVRCLKFDGYNIRLLWNKPVVGRSVQNQTVPIEKSQIKPTQTENHKYHIWFGCIDKSFFDASAWFGLVCRIYFSNQTEPNRNTKNTN